MKNHKTITTKILALAALFLLSSQTNHALIFTSGAASTEGLGAFTGTFDYSASNDGTTAQVDVTITNTTPTAGGFLTAIAFNNPSDLITGATLTSLDNANFSILSGGINAAPYGDFDIGATSGNSWLAGKNPNRGLAVGDTATFTFNLTGSSLNTLTADSFFQTLSSGNVGQGHGHQAFAARFRGMTEGAGSDKVIGFPGGAPVPEPGTFAMFGIAALMLGFISYRSRKNK